MLATQHKKLGFYLTEATSKYLVPPSDFRLLPRWHEIWKQCAGEPLALHTYPVYYVDGCLVLHAASSVWMSKVIYQRAKLIRCLRLDPSLPGLTDLHVRLARNSVHAGSNQQIMPKLSEDSRAFITAFADSIADPVLRQALQKLGREPV